MSQTPTSEILARLPTAVRAAAYVRPNGELAWPNASAADAIAAISAAGYVVLGLDSWTVTRDGGIREVPGSEFQPKAQESAAEQVRRSEAEALRALPDIAALGTHVLITCA